MHIKLISPRMTLRPMDSELKRVLSPSRSLVIVAALTPPEHHVTIADENLAPLTFKDTPDLVGINVNVDTSQNAYRIGARYRQKGVPVILGGIHASANPEEALCHADAVCIGEAECVWQTILEDVQHGRLKPRYQNPNPTDLSLVPWYASVPQTQGAGTHHGLRLESLQHLQCGVRTHTHDLHATARRLLKTVQRLLLTQKHRQATARPETPAYPLPAVQPRIQKIRQGRRLDRQSVGPHESVWAPGPSLILWDLRQCISWLGHVLSRRILWSCGCHDQRETLA